MTKLIHMLAVPMHAIADPIHERLSRNNSTRTEAQRKKLKHACRLGVGTLFMLTASFVMTTAEHWHLPSPAHVAVESAAGLLHGFGSIPFCSFLAKALEIETNN